MSEGNGAAKPNGSGSAQVVNESAAPARGDAEIPPVDPPKKGNGGGWPNRCTSKLTKAICDSIKLGNYFETACKAQGISPVTARDWLMRGKKDRVEMRRSPYATFHEEVEKAHAQGEQSLVNTMRVHAQKDYRATEIMLARKFPKRWGKTIEVAVPDATPNSPFAGRTDEELAYFVEKGHWPDEAP